MKQHGFKSRRVRQPFSHPPSICRRSGEPQHISNRPQPRPPGRIVFNETVSRRACVNGVAVLDVPQSAC